MPTIKAGSLEQKVSKVKKNKGIIIYAYNQSRVAWTNSVTRFRILYSITLLGVINFLKNFSLVNARDESELVDSIVKEVKKVLIDVSNKKRGKF